jgi:hypothetical protein
VYPQPVLLPVLPSVRPACRILISHSAAVPSSVCRTVHHSARPSPFFSLRPAGGAAPNSYSQTPLLARHFDPGHWSLVHQCVDSRAARDRDPSFASLPRINYCTEARGLPVLLTQPLPGDHNRSAGRGQITGWAFVLNGLDATRSTTPTGGPLRSSTHKLDGGAILSYRAAQLSSVVVCVVVVLRRPLSLQPRTANYSVY